MADWTCYKCGAKGKKTINELIDDGWHGFDIRYLHKGIKKRLRVFACPEHKTEFQADQLRVWHDIDEGKEVVI